VESRARTAAENGSRGDAAHALIQAEVFTVAAELAHEIEELR
jgi:hypothetical protein